MAYRSSTTNTGSGTSAVGNRPSGTAAGDVLVAFVCSGDDGEIPTISGWTLISRVSGSGQDPAAALFSRVADGSEPSSWTWTLPGYANWVVQVAAHTGINTASPILAQSASWSRAYGETAAASVTTAATATLIQVACVPNQSGGYTWNAALAERQDQQGYYILAGMADDVDAAAGTHSYTATATGVSQWQRSFLVALALAGGSPPGQVTGLSATAVSSSQINLSWDATSGADSYKVERSPTGAGSWTEIATGVTVTSYSSTGLAASTTYFYRVRATNANGDGSYASTASATTQSGGGSPPATPTGVSASALSASGIRVSWSSVSGATGYTVERSPNGTSGWASVGTPAASPFDDSGLSPATTYSYRVSATNSSGSSSPSSVVSATTSAAGSAQSYAANAAWRWIQVEWPALTRHRQSTFSGVAAGGTTVFYLATSRDGLTWSYFSGPIATGRMLTAVASQVAAEAAAPSITGITTNRIDLPGFVEGRFFRLYFRNTTHTTSMREFYPRRLVQADDVQAEAIKAIHIAAGAITADKLTATAIDGFTITGALIRTAASGARIEMGGSTLAAIDSGGVQRVTITPDGLRTRNSAGVIQVEASAATDGALTFGAGRGRLNSDAMIWQTPFVSPSTTYVLKLQREDTSAQIGDIGAGMDMGGGSFVSLAARQTGAPLSAALELRAGGTTLTLRHNVDGTSAVLSAALTAVAGISTPTVTVSGAGGAFWMADRVNPANRWALYSHSNILRLYYQPNTADRFTLDGGGNGLFGGTVTAAQFSVTSQHLLSSTGTAYHAGNVGVRTAVDAAIAIVANGATTGTTQFGLAVRDSASANNLYVRNDGYVWVRGTIDVGGLNNRSDRRLKRDIAPIPDALGRVLAIPARQWRWRSDPDGRVHYGPIAQAAEAVAPELVVESGVGPGERRRRGTRGTLSIDLGSLVGLHHGAIQQLAARVATLEAQLAR